MPDKDIPKVDRLVDLKGFLCPLPALRARKELMALETDKILAIETTDPKTKIDIPDVCKHIGATYLQAVTVDSVIIHIIKR